MGALSDADRGRLLGNRVRERREAVGLKPGQLAVFAGVSRSYISRLEAGHYPQPSVAHLAKIARALHCGVGDLLADSVAIESDELSDPEFDMLFSQAKQELPPEDIEALKEQFKLSMRLRRERRARDDAE